MGWAQGTGYCGKGKGGLMGEKRDYYAVLGVDRDAEGSRIKKAYRKLAKKYHPDTSAGNAQAEEKFREVTEDYEILSDPEKRKLYDRFGHAAFDGSAAADGGPGGHYGQGSPFEDWFRRAAVPKVVPICRRKSSSALTKRHSLRQSHPSGSADEDRHRSQIAESAYPRRHRHRKEHPPEGKGEARQERHPRRSAAESECGREAGLRAPWHGRLYHHPHPL